jgi:hypothetical protein
MVFQRLLSAENKPPPKFQEVPDAFGTTILLDSLGEAE